MKGKFITFEGIDGSGKSTQLRLIEHHLTNAGHDVVTTCEPGGTPLGRHLRSAFLETTETVSPLAELLLFAADRAQHVEHLIRPSLAARKVVISDRYADATAAYQGAGRGFDADTIAEVIGLATGGLKPDLTLFFDITVATALERMNTRQSSGATANRMDSETAEFYQRVREAYLDIAKHEPERVCVIDAEGSIEDIYSKVVTVLSERMN
ncbi:MAG TPA: dTMP kinase [Pyrinomonadaceae bacterium]|nr:dTMP kinase [Pyrinomonadaceae bacterium]